jgi:four helix bundle protein
MFDFEKLEVYQIAKEQNIKVQRYLETMGGEQVLKDQWRKASLGSVLNLAEGTGKMNNADKRHYYSLARSSVFECAALLEMLKELGSVSEFDYQDFYAGYERISKMLLAMYRSLSPENRKNVPPRPSRIDEGGDIDYNREQNY